MGGDDTAAAATGIVSFPPFFPVAPLPSAHNSTTAELATHHTGILSSAAMSLPIGGALCATASQRSNDGNNGSVSSGGGHVTTMPLPHMLMNGGGSATTSVSPAALASQYTACGLAAVGGDEAGLATASADAATAALSFFQQAVYVQPGYKPALQYIATIYARDAASAPNAVALCRQLLAAMPRDGALWAVLGTALATGADTMGAFQALQLAMQCGYATPSVWMVRAYARAHAHSHNRILLLS